MYYISTHVVYCTNLASSFSLYVCRYVPYLLLLQTSVRYLSCMDTARTVRDACADGGAAVWGVFVVAAPVAAQVERIVETWCSAAWAMCFGRLRGALQ